MASQTRLRLGTVQRQQSLFKLFTPSYPNDFVFFPEGLHAQEQMFRLLGGGKAGHADVAWSHLRL
jgi:hypothetical protein